jgi:hypothetical protein
MTSYIVENVIDKRRCDMSKCRECTYCIILSEEYEEITLARCEIGQGIADMIDADDEAPDCFIRKIENQNIERE